MLFAFTASPEAGRARIEARRARYVVMCANTADVRSYIEAAPDGLAARLVEGHSIPGFTRVNIAASRSLLVFAVGEPGDEPADELRGRLAFTGLNNTPGG